MIEANAKLVFYTVWIIAQCDKAIIDYYRWFYNRRYHILLTQPRHGAHISVARGAQEGIEPGTWERNLDGPEITFWYDPNPDEEEKYVWLKVVSPDLEKVRTDIGLSPKPPGDYHLTLGRKDFG